MVRKATHEELTRLMKARTEYSLKDTRAQAWAKYRARHPEVLANWGEQNGRYPHDHPLAKTEEKP